MCEISSDWFMNGNYLIVIVTVCIILPLALMKHLGTTFDPTVALLSEGQALALCLRLSLSSSPP